MTTESLLSTYLNDHLTGATAGVELFKRAAKHHAGTDGGETLAALAAEVEEDRASLQQLMSDLEVRQNTPMIVLGWLGEKAGRLKPNGYLLRRSPLSDVVELEALRIAVMGKTAGWQVLRSMAQHDGRISPAQLDALLERADRQAELLRELHLRAAERRMPREPRP
jgi:hypothetical protein